MTVMLSALPAPWPDPGPAGPQPHTSASQAQDTPFPVFPKGPRETGLVWGEGWGAGERTGCQGRRPRPGSPVRSDMKHPDPGRPTLGGPGRHLGNDEHPVRPSPGMGCPSLFEGRSIQVRLEAGEGAQGVQLPGCTAEGRWRGRLRRERGPDTDSVSAGSLVQPRPGGHLDALWPCHSLQPTPSLIRVPRGGASPPGTSCKQLEHLNLEHYRPSSSLSSPQTEG